jgi:Luciferase-like monooxygenase/Hemerythrin HHE cation binding domain
MDYGHDLLFGSFITPSARQPHEAVGLVQVAERAGLDLATFQDHPYQPAFLDTWTLMSYAAAATSRIRLTGNVLNLPLRQPVVLARSVASLDLLTGGRVELGIGAGGFWDAIEAVSGFIAMGDDPAAIQRFGEEVAPAVRELVSAAREAGRPFEPDPPARDVVHVSDRWDETTRPVAPPAPDGIRPAARRRGVGAHLVQVHDHLREELTQVRDLLHQVRDGAVDPAYARSALNMMSLRQNNWTLGAYCAAFCTVVTQHHSIEDGSVFPHLRRADPALGPVLDRLAEEHVIIHEVVEGVDCALVDLLRDPGDFGGVQKALDELTDALLSHLAYEEEQIVEPLSRLGFFPGQV